MKSPKETGLARYIKDDKSGQKQIKGNGLRAYVERQNQKKNDYQ